MRIRKVTGPVVTDAASRFVVATYWWGRGDANWNTMRPCPTSSAYITHDPVDGSVRARGDPAPIKRPAISHEAVAHRWRQSVAAAGCNHVSIEYDDVRRRELQSMITFKPRFILAMLDACHPRAVVYADSDVTVKHYPALFDASDVDFMALGWYFDTRINWTTETSTGRHCLSNPYVFATSGPLFYFSQSARSRALLEAWADACDAHPDLADDAMLAIVYNTQGFLLRTKTIQLPIEYLMYKDNRRHFKTHCSADFVQRYVGRVYIEHPDCLSPERYVAERIRSERPSRVPDDFDTLVAEHYYCIAPDWRRFGTASASASGSGGSTAPVPLKFYEYVAFASAREAATMHQALVALDALGAIRLVEYADAYGPAGNATSQYNKAAAERHRRAGVVSSLMALALESSSSSASTTTTMLPASTAATSIVLVGYADFETDRDAIPKALAALASGRDVILAPESVVSSASGRRSASVRRVVERVREEPDVELVCKNRNRAVAGRYSRDFALDIDSSSAIYLAAKSRVLRHLLSMTPTLHRLGENFNKSYVFVSRIYCAWT